MPAAAEVRHHVLLRRDSNNNDKAWQHVEAAAAGDSDTVAWLTGGHEWMQLQFGVSWFQHQTQTATHAVQQVELDPDVGWVAHVNRLVHLSACPLFPKHDAHWGHKGHLFGWQEQKQSAAAAAGQPSGQHLAGQDPRHCACT